MPTYSRDAAAFDLVLGNPPWVKVEWNEAGILGERNPLFAIRKISASDLATLRAEASLFHGLKAAWTSELEEAEGTQSFFERGAKLPPCCRDQDQLYKGFLPLAWRLASHSRRNGPTASRGPLRRPGGRSVARKPLPSACEPTSSSSTSFHSSRVCTTCTKFSINVYGGIRREPGFEHLANLFSPNTVDACYQHDGSGDVGGYKTENGELECRRASRSNLSASTSLLLTYLRDCTTRGHEADACTPSGTARRKIDGRR